MTNTQPLASRIADAIIAVDDLRDPFYDDRHNVYLLVRDMRDELAGHDDDDIADAPITGPLLDSIIDALISHRSR